MQLFGTVLLLTLLLTSNSLSIPVLDLKSTASYVILAGSSITGIPPCAMIGDIGLSPAAGSFITGFDSSNVTGIIYVVDASGPVGSVIDPSRLTTAKGDITIAYNDAAGRTPVPTGTFLNPGSGNMGGLNLVPGLYKFTSSAAITGSNLTLTGNSSDVWIFQIASSLNVGSGIKIILAGGAQAANIFWQVGTSATIGTYAIFKGTILADQSISFDTGASLEGRALAFTAAVTMGSAVVTTKPILLNAPIFSVSPSSLTFGNVVNGKSKLDSVVISNIGNSNLNITSISSSNPSFTFTPATSTVIPAGTLKFYVTFSPTSDGLKSGEIYFNHNAANTKDSISVFGSGVSPRFTVSPNNINFGNVRNGTSKMDSVTVTNTGTSNLNISNLTILNLRYSTSPSSATIAPGGSLKFYVTFAPLVDGIQNGSVVFNHDAANLKDSILLIGFGISPKFTVTQSNLNFGNVRNETTKRDSVTVTNTGNANLIISNLTILNSLYTSSPTSATITPGGSLKFYITFAPLVDGIQLGSVVFNHDAANLKDSILLTGNGVSPRFTITPLTLNYGNVVNGTSKIDSAIVTNTGTSDLIISNIVNSNTFYSISPLSATITPGNTQKYYITFAPLIDGLQDSYFYFTSNAKIPKDSLRVIGTGVSPKFQIVQSNLNFGNVHIDSTKRDSITVTNIGTSDLIISSITNSNTFYSISSLSSTTLTPGSSKKYYITFAPTYNAVQTSNLVFNHNTPNLKDTVKITGNGVSPIFVSYPDDLKFGFVPIGTFKTDSLMVKNTGNIDLIISSVTSSNSYFTVNPSSSIIPAGSTQSFKITFAPIKDREEASSIIFINNSKSSYINITVNGTGAISKFYINKNAIDFGIVNDGLSKIDSVLVSNTGNDVLHINDIISSNKYFSIDQKDLYIQSGSSKYIYINFSPLVKGIQDATIIFYHNGISKTDLLLATGVGLENNFKAQFSSNTKLLNLGTAYVGKSNIRSLIITDIGTANLVISKITNKNSQFTITPLKATIAPNKSTEFVVKFSPTNTGIFNDQLIFEHNDGTDTINIVGQGVLSLPVITINDAIKLPIGTEFICEGVVTRTLGKFTRIQDSTGALTLLQNSGTFFDDVKNSNIQISDVIRVQGRVTEYNFLKVINGTDLIGYQRLSRLSVLPVAKKVTLLELANNGEQYESSAILLTNLTITNIGFSLFQEASTYQVIDSSDKTNRVTIRIENKENTDMDGTLFIGNSITFQGILSQYNLEDPKSGYQLTPILSNDLRFVPTGVDDSQLSNTNELYNNYPNPFQNSTTIKYNVNSFDFVTLKVYNLLGNEIATLVNKFEESGVHSVKFTNSSIDPNKSSSMYFYEIKIGAYLETKQMIYLK